VKYSFMWREISPSFNVNLRAMTPFTSDPRMGWRGFLRPKIKRVMSPKPVSISRLRILQSPAVIVVA
jgi:hypothetical protein